MKTYHDIQGDGGSNVVGQVEALHATISTALAGVRHVVAIASGKGGVGKSTLTMGLARALRRDGASVSILDGDLNGPCQARLAGLEGAPWIPGDDGLAIPRNRAGIGVASFGSLLASADPLEFDSVATGEEQTWRGTREFALLAQLLGSVAWGELDFLLFDLPPGTDRTIQFAHFLGPEASFVLTTIPSDLSRDVVARSVTALERADARLLGYIENMAGYYCRDCGEIRPLFGASDIELPVACLGRIPFDPALADFSAPLHAETGSEAFDRLAAVAAALKETLEDER